MWLRVLKPWPFVLLLLATGVLVPQFANGHSNPPLQTLANLASSFEPVYQVSLDADSVSQTDLNIVLSASQVSSFRIGAIVNSSGANPLTDVAGWQFGITYNASAFIPQGEPGSALPIAPTALVGMLIIH